MPGMVHAHLANVSHAHIETRKTKTIENVDYNRILAREYRGPEYYQT